VKLLQVNNNHQNPTLLVFLIFFLFYSVSFSTQNTCVCVCVSVCVCVCVCVVFVWVYMLSACVDLTVFVLKKFKIFLSKLFDSHCTCARRDVIFHQHFILLRYNYTVCNITVSTSIQWLGILSWTPVAHACNPSYSGGRDQKDHALKLDLVNSSVRPYLKKDLHKRGWSGSRCRPWVQAKYCKKKKKKSELWTY
jgi:hypothetical protein